MQADGIATRHRHPKRLVETINGIHDYENPLAWRNAHAVDDLGAGGLPARTGPASAFCIVERSA